MANEKRGLLESWKEISAYLKRSEKTCRRFEASLGLPVHRLDGTPRARVFAYVDELDRWREEKLHSREAAAEALQRSRRRRHLLLAGLFGAAAAVSLLAWRLSVSRPAPPPDVKPVLAVLPFENLSGDQDLDWLSTGLAELVTTDLFQSRYLDVMGGDRVYSVLKELKLAESRKYSQEDLLTIAKGANADHLGFGSFMKTGENIIIAFNLQRMPEGKLISSRKVTCQGQAGIGDGVDELGRQVKADIGLDPRQIATDFDEKIGRITTRSPEALKLYLESVRSRGATPEKRWALLTKAIEIDPGFAMAYNLLGSNQMLRPERHGGRKEIRAEGAKNLKKALELSDRVSTRERYIIQRAYFEHVEKDFDKTLQTYKKLLELYPDDYLGHKGIAELYRSVKEDYAKAIEHLELLYEKDRRSRDLTLLLATCYRNVGAPEKALKVYRYYLDNQWYADMVMRKFFYETLWMSGAFELALEEADTMERLDPKQKVERIFPYYLMGNYPAAEKLCEAALQSEPVKIKWLARDWLQDIYVTQGQFERAKEQISQGLQEIGSMSEADPRARNILLKRRITISLVEGDLDRAMADVDSILEDFQKLEDNAKAKTSMPPWDDLMTKVGIWLEMGRSDKAQDMARMIADLVRARALERRHAPPEDILTVPLAERFIQREKGYLDLIQGKIELKRGRLSKAIGLLQKAQIPSNEFTARTHIPKCCYIEALALAYEQAGKLPLARDEYEKILRLTVSRGLQGLTHAMSLYRLGKICERQGDRAKATEYYGKFAELWKNSDRVRPELEDARTRLGRLMSR